ncbi:hypothetical protein OG883_20975 [Streptomyces sp. NBC_01142]|uniref:hypothetical protein n=1 Tax=Streptomyces sp. NBC_01142 TaxID=2975865 RepID=UPI00225152C1|nr:hypothetical protein [Streptomyces sp. NBC_01142]MCX4822317.1 hypothetical protein [Streptomyces sp. NBC_01142]
MSLSDTESPTAAPARPRRSGIRVAVLSLLAVSAGLGLFWLALVLTTQEPRSRTSDVDAAETFAHVSVDQHPDEIRFYVAAEAKVARSASGAVVSSRLRYDIKVVRDSSVADFIRTYDIGRRGKAVASRTGAVYTEEIDGRVRTVRVEYRAPKHQPDQEPEPYTGSDPLKDPRLGTSAATVVVTAED